MTKTYIIEFGDVPSKDPIAYAMGFMRGLAGAPLDDPGEGDELAPAYVDGHALGVRVSAKKAPMPGWAKEKVPGS